MRNALHPGGRRIMAGLYFVVLCVSVGTAALADNPPIKPDEGRPVVDWTEAEKFVGEVAYVQGFILEVGSSRSLTFLNFDDKRPGLFTAIIPTESLSAFPASPETLYKHKNVRIRGLVTTYRDRPQIRVTDPSQIEILPGEPAKSSLKTRKKVTVGPEFTIATYNVLNLFDAEDDPYHDDTSTPAKPRDQLERVAKTIQYLNPDVIAFQEVENRWYLERFIQVFLPDMGYEHIVHYEGNDLRGIDVCLASRIPVGPVTSYRHVTFTSPDGKTRHFSRDILAVRLEPEQGAPFEMWVVHLKSNYGGREYAESIRVAEAKKVRALLDTRLQQQPDAAIILCGDFNDTWESETLKTLVGEGAHALKAFFESIPENDRVTYNREPHRSMIDFILATPAMAKRYVANSYRIVPGAVETSGSDHNPVAARFRAK